MVADAEVRVRLDVVARELRRAAPTRRGSAASARTRRRPRRAGLRSGCASAARSASSASSGSGSSTVSGGPPGEKPTSVIASGCVRDRAPVSWLPMTEPEARPMTDDRGRRPKQPRSTSRSRRRGSCSCGTRSPRTPVRCCRAGCPASTSPRRASGRPRPPPQRLAKLPIAAVYASPIERTTQTAQLHRRAPRPRGAAAARRDRSRLRRLDRRQDRRPREDRRVEGRAGRAVARAVPGRRVDPRDAGAHGRRARRGRRRASARDGRRREPRRSDQVGDRALHRHAPRPVPAGARVARRR